jgi:hypothetical protein
VNATTAISLEDVRAFRQHTIDNGYLPVRVQTRGKAPVGREWQRGEQPDVLTNVQPDAANTGMLGGASLRRHRCR